MHAVGIDLGTTKSCLAVANYDAETDTLTCACLPFPEPGLPGQPIAVPSIVAVHDGELAIGHAARRMVGRKGYTPERNVFRESKNDIGLRYTYWKAPDGFRSATEIASHLIGHLASNEHLDGHEAAHQWVVTVPASFQGPQRSATLAAASSLSPDRDAVKLLEEPYAAFLDLLHRHPASVVEQVGEGGNVLVFDFGGGTCDVAIFALDGRDGPMQPRLRATSRYSRIGGGDIDRAIVHEHLVPMLLERHELSASSFGWQVRRRALEPQLLPLAERLKIALCRKLEERETAGEVTQDVEVMAAGEYEIVVDDSSYFLESPTLSVADFEELLSGFLDPNPAPDDNSEYVQRGSIFSPILHALARARLEADDINAVVMAGSSTMIPQVRAALRRYFPDAALIGWRDAAELQGAIARGAALQALALASGHALIEPVCSGELGIQTRQGVLPLVAAGSLVPSANAEPVILQAPADSFDLPVELAVEVVTDANRTLGRTTWLLSPPVLVGERLGLQWRLDHNQCLSLELQRLDDDHGEPFQHRFVAPVAHLDHGHSVRARMLEREQDIREDRVASSDVGDAYTSIARDAAALGEHAKALHFVGLAMQQLGASQYLLNLKGMYCERVGDSAGAEHSYERSGNSVACFNLALMQSKQRRYDDALISVDKALEITHARPYQVLKADIVEQLGRPQEARLLYQDALNGQLQLEGKDGWELHWLAKAARKLDAGEHRQAIEAQQKTWQESVRVVPRIGVLPDQG